jgi:integrase
MGRPVPFSVLEHEILARYARKASATCAKFRQVFKEFRRYAPGCDCALCGGTDLALVRCVQTTRCLNADSIGAWVDWMGSPLSAGGGGRAPMTLRSLLGTLRTVCSVAQTKGFVKQSPFVAWPLAGWFRADSCDALEEGEDEWGDNEGWGEPERHLSAGQIACVLDLLAREASGSWDLADRLGVLRLWFAARLEVLARLLAFGGFRKKEALCLTWKDVRLGSGLIRVKGRKKNRLKTVGSARVVGIPEGLAGPLSAWKSRVDLSPLSRCDVPCKYVLPGVWLVGPWTGGGPGTRALDQLYAAGRRAGVDGFGFQMIRHSWGTLAEQLWGFPGPVRARVMGHTKERTSLENYCHVDAPSIRLWSQAIVFPRVEPLRVVPLDTYA